MLFLRTKSGSKIDCKALLHLIRWRSDCNSGKIKSKLNRGFKIAKTERGKGTLRSIKGIPHIPLLIDLPLIVVYYKTNLVQKYIIFDRHQDTIDSDNNIIN